MTLIDGLLKVADAYCAHVQRSRSRISTLIFGDGLRLEGVSRGKDIQTRSYEKAMLWFSSNWPDDLNWPIDVERPTAPKQFNAAVDAEAVAP